jgi:hypothetical protein
MYTTYKIILVFDMDFETLSLLEKWKYKCSL